MGLPVEGDDPAPAPAAAGAAVPATTAAAAPAMKAPVPIPAIETPAPAEPPPPWVEAAETRQKIPYWVMPVLIFLPVWLIMYVGTLEAPTREEGVIFEGSVVYEENCASCHGAGGGGGVGPAFSNGAIIETFADVEAQTAWVAQGSQVFRDAGRTSYGDTNVAIGHRSGALMPAFAEDLTTEELVAVIFYERIELGGHEEELELAETIWDRLESGEIEVPEHFVEGIEGDLDGTGEVNDVFAATKAELAEAEVASE